MGNDCPKVGVRQNTTSENRQAKTPPVPHNNFHRQRIAEALPLRVASQKRTYLRKPWVTRILIPEISTGDCHWYESGTQPSGISMIRWNSYHRGNFVRGMPLGGAVTVWPEKRVLIPQTAFVPASSRPLRRAPTCPVPLAVFCDRQAHLKRLGGSLERPGVPAIADSAGCQARGKIQSALLLLLILLGRFTKRAKRVSGC